MELPRRTAIIEEFASHMAAIAKKLEEDEESGSQRYIYVRAGPDHFSTAFTYDVIAWERDEWAAMPLISFIDDDVDRGPWIPVAALFGRG